MTTTSRSYAPSEVEAHVRRWAASQVSESPFSWPTDGLDYDSHIAFVKHRNANWHGGTHDEFVAFALAWATALKGDKAQ